MQKMVPEIAGRYFTLTIGREDRDFSSERGVPPEIELLQSLGSIVYAALVKSVPKSEHEGELKFGDFYVGQVVKLQSGEFNISSGRSGGLHSGNGQLNLYVGFGDTFPYQAYYLSMACADQDLLSVVQKYAGKGIKPNQAVGMKENDITQILTILDYEIMKRPRLRAAAEYGQRVISGLSI